MSPENDNIEVSNSNLPASEVASTPENVTPPLDPPLHKKRPVRWVREIVNLGLIWLICFLVLRFIIPSYEVKGYSMQPTYAASGNRVLTDQLFFKLFGNPSRQDIVVLTNPRNAAEEPLIKRVIGLPGDTIEIRNGTVIINGTALDEPYIKNKGDYDFPRTTLEKSCYFVLGDNRPISLDSHYFGCVQRDLIQAKVLLRYPWPD